MYEDSSHPASSTRLSIHIIHLSARERRVPFAKEANARAFFESLRNATHPAEPDPVRFASLSMRVGSGPWTVIDAFGDEGGAR